jgi:TetR/AcrR family tetracycline transcriptional repressor
MQDNLELSDKQHEIIEAALELLKDKGYRDLSMRDIAKKLKVKAPAIYWHFKSKTVLVDYMAEYILRKGMGDFKPRENEQEWQDWLVGHISLFRKAMLSYPDGGRVIAGAHLFPAVTLAKFMDYAISSLHSAGIGISVAQSIAQTTIHYTFGYVIEEQSDKLDQSAMSDHAINSVEITNLIEFKNSGGTNDEKFLSGLELIIIGGNNKAISENKQKKII